MAVEAAKEAGDEKLAEKIAGGSFSGGLKYNYGHCLYIFDLGERAKGVQMMTLSHAQFKDLDERKFKLWSKKLAKNPSYPCPVSSVYDAYPVEIEKRRNGAKTEYLFSIDNEFNGGTQMITGIAVNDFRNTGCSQKAASSSLVSGSGSDSFTAIPVIIWVPPLNSLNSATAFTACGLWRRTG